MNETIAMDLNGESLTEKPGAQLAGIRSHRGYRIDYVAEKLNLRVQLIELLESDDYQNMPEPVFIKGYLRAYAKLMEVDPAAYIALFNQHYVQETKSEPMLWQSTRQSNKAEHTLRWVTAGFALLVFAAIMVWWHNANEHDVVFPTPKPKAEPQLEMKADMKADASPSTPISDLVLTPPNQVSIPLDIPSE
jgi:cytoskeleton protein RodZ